MSSVATTIQLPKVRFSKKWFNPLYFILEDILKDKGIRLVLVFGGKSSSKTASICQLLTKEAYCTNASTIAFRKESTIIKTTLKKSFNLALDTTRLYPGFDNLEFSYRCHRGAEIVLKGLDKEEKAKGIESYKYLYLDELNHFEKEEFRQFNLSLRGIEGQKILASWNPVSETSWVKKDLVDQYTFLETDYKLPCPQSYVKISTCGKVILIKTTYEDNYWISGAPCGTYGYRDENLIAEYLKLKDTDYNAYRVNVLGEWGVIKTGGEFFKSFNPEKHVQELIIDTNQPLHISLDENVVPYVTVSLWQFNYNLKQLRQVHELPCKEPDNNAPKAAQMLINYLRSVGFANVIYIYGDPSAGKRSTIDPNNASFYDKFIEVLQKAGFHVIKRVQRSAPQVALSAAFVNAIWEANLYGYSITIAAHCRTSIDDYSQVKEAPDGTMLKVREKNKDTGQTFEPIGHFSDALRYFITTVLKAEFDLFCNPQKRHIYSSQSQPLIEDDDY